MRYKKQCNYLSLWTTFKEKTDTKEAGRHVYMYFIYLTNFSLRTE